MSFPNLPSSLDEALVARGYTAFTSVQQAVLEPEAAGRDLIVSAQTGSGKTVAFGLACAPELLNGSDRLGPAGEPLALVIAPTRELAMQVQRELEWLYAKAGARVIACVGGMDIRNEQRNLAHGAHIVVGTPGRLRDHLERGKLLTGSLRTVILDEADEMLDMGFREELEEILDATPQGRRTMLFSATMPKPIAALARAYQRDALKIVTIGTDRGHGDITYQAIAVAPNDIEHSVVNLLRFHESETAIVFCGTRESVRRLHASLIERGFDAVALSGEHSQNERNHAMQALRDRRARVCVATDVAARGIDLPDLRLVIHADIPRDAESLQHRSGRTGRAGKKGTAVLIVPFTRRKRVEGMLRGAKISTDWIAAPSADDIRGRDNDRLVEMLLQPVELDDTDRQLAARLLEKKSAEEIAAALVKMHRSRLPAPEDLLAGGAPQRRERGGPDEVRPGFEESAWFRMSVGRRQKADPRWLLPLLCRRGHITKSEVGAIRIGEAETFVQIPRAAANKFAEALKRVPADGDDGDIRIEAASGPPSQERRGPLRPKPGGFSRPNGPGRPEHRGPMRPKRKNPTPR